MVYKPLKAKELDDVATAKAVRRAAKLAEEAAEAAPQA